MTGRWWPVRPMFRSVNQLIRGWLVRPVARVFDRPIAPRAQIGLLLLIRDGLIMAPSARAEHLNLFQVCRVLLRKEARRGHMIGEMTICDEASVGVATCLTNYLTDPYFSISRTPQMLPKPADANYRADMEHVMDGTQIKLLYRSRDARF